MPRASKIWGLLAQWARWNSNIFRALTGQEKTQANCLGQVKFALGQVKIEVWWFHQQVKLASVVLLVDKAWTLHTYWASNIVVVGATENWNVLAHWATGSNFFVPETGASLWSHLQSSWNQHTRTCQSPYCSDRTSLQPQLLPTM